MISHGCLYFNLSICNFLCSDGAWGQQFNQKCTAQSTVPIYHKKYSSVPMDFTG